MNAIPSLFHVCIKPFVPNVNPKLEINVQLYTRIAKTFDASVNIDPIVERVVVPEPFDSKKYKDYWCTECKFSVFGSKPECRRCGFKNPRVLWSQSGFSVSSYLPSIFHSQPLQPTREKKKHSIVGWCAGCGEHSSLRRDNECGHGCKREYISEKKPSRVGDFWCKYCKFWVFNKKRNCRCGRATCAYIQLYY